MSEPLWLVEWGLVPYEEALEVQSRIAAARQRGEVPDSLLLLEHPPVYTRGRRSEEAELPMGISWYQAQGIEVRDTDRGGRVTYHGPGQLVAYPIISLQPLGDDVHAFVRALERVMIATLAEWGIEAGTIEGLTGVWVSQPNGGSRKIGSIGIHVSRGVTTHGLAVNVSNDLQPFEWIVPCGIDDCRMTSVSRELGSEQSIAGFSDSLGRRLAGELGRTPEPLRPERLLERLGAGSADRGSVGALP